MVLRLVPLSVGGHMNRLACVGTNMLTSDTGALSCCFNSSIASTPYIRRFVISRTAVYSFR